MKKCCKNLIPVLLLLAGFHAGIAQTIIYNQSFSYGVTPTTQCTAWSTFRAALLSTYAYRGFTISGSMNPLGISCTSPTVALAVANALRTGTNYTGTSDGQTWYVGTGCGGGCGGGGGEVVELSNQGTCSCATGYSVRPAINNLNWGGINGATCSALDQTLIVTFNAGPSSPTVTGATHYCVGDNMTLTATSTETAPSFTWSGPSGFSATTASITISGITLANAGVYSVTVTTLGLTSLPTLDTIVVNPLPTITLGTNPTVCTGGSFAYLPYTATTGVPTTYSVVYGTGALAAGFTNITSAALPSSPIALPVPAGLATGVYTGTVKVSNSSCSSADMPFVINVIPSPTAITGSTTLCTSSTSLLGSTPAGGTWSSITTGVATVDSVSGVVSGVSIGSSVIVYRIATGCTATTTVNVAGITGPTSVCQGATATLGVTIPGGSWSSGTPLLATVGSGTGIVTGLSMGAALISYTTTSGCAATWTMTVLPNAPIAGRDSVCIGSDRLLTDIVGGGTWHSGTPAVASVAVDSGFVHGLATGSTVITYTLANGCVDHATVRVVAAPAPILGTAQVCEGGGTTNLFDATGGGTWSSNNTAAATVSATGVVTGLFADTTSINYIIQPGCKVTHTFVVNPLPSPVMADKAIICPGMLDTLHDASIGGAWSSVTPALGTVDTLGVVTTLGGGTATFKYTLPTGCSGTTSISIYPGPPVNITFDWETATFYATPGYVSYQWYDSLQGLIPGATSPNLAALYTEYYYVVVTDTNGCKGTSALYEFNTGILGVSQLPGGGKVSIYPNPVSGGTIYIDAPVRVKAVISSISGRKEMEKADAKDMDISGLPAGVYLIAVYNDQGQILTVQKLVKE